MIVLNKKIWLVLLVLGIAACSTKHAKPLPYYIAPDLTPLWITKTSDSFSHIHMIPAFSFIDQDGKIFTEKNVAGKIFVANFFFTSCGSICPKMTDNFSRLQKTFAGDNEILLLSYTVNPERDTPAALKKYAGGKKINGAKWHLLTGSKHDLYTLAKKEFFAGDSLGYYGDLNQFLHTEKVFLVDKHRRIRGVYNGTLPVEMDRIAEDIKTLKEEE